MNQIMKSSKLYELCNKNNWFTCGSVSQYDKLFDLLEDGGCVEELALVIWLCSSKDWTVVKIKKELREAIA